MNYLELSPSKSLRPFVRCYWSMQSTGVGGIEQIIPDGCPEIILNRADRFERINADGTRHLQAEILLVGPMQRPIEIAPTGVVNLLGIRFEPGGLHALLGLPVHEIEGEDHCLGSINRNLRGDLSGVNAARDPYAQMEEVETILARQFDSRGVRAGTRTSLGLVGSAVELVEAGVFNAMQLSERLGINRRALERLFRTQVGLSPKVFARVRRLTNVIEQLDQKAAMPNWTELALSHGYSDQSHLIREFRLMADTTPESYLAERTEFATCFNSIDMSHSSNT